ncbi:MAG: UbiA family prenyltransferase [Victivallales bacterium]|nr:UbiA family prenyltransferase [Victivallales bacterium]
MKSSSDNADAETAKSPESDYPFFRRYWIYQRERFPLFGYLPMVAAFTVSAISYSRICRGAAAGIGGSVFCIGYFTAFVLFLLLRLFDEFKDAEEDAKYRPYRAVPRGVVSFRELRWAIVLSISATLLLNGIILPRMLPLLLVALGYILIMWREFFVPEWLRRHPVAYMLTHMMILPVSDFYTSGLDWHLAKAPIPAGMVIFLAMTFCNGMVIEIGRKIRPPEEEETGVQTYSSLWGAKRAAWIWLAIISLTLVLAAACCRRGGYLLRALPLLLPSYIVCCIPAAIFLRRKRCHRKIELASGVWTILMYLIVGLFPRLLAL